MRFMRRLAQAKQSMFEEIDRYRHEHKYIESEINLIGIETRLGALLKRDSHVYDNGCYSIRSLYFDDLHNTFLNENIDGVDERTKWRIRIYDRKRDHISLERKMRKSDLIAKQSCTVSEAEFDAILNKSLDISPDNPPLLNVFIKEIKLRALRPVIVVEYERTPFVCAEGNTRVTIDRNIRSSSEVGAFLEDRVLACRPVLMSGQNLIEVKYDAYLPDHIAHAIEHGRMRRETFSKYYLACRLPYSAKGRYVSLINHGG